MLKPGEDTLIYRELHRLEGIIAHADVISQEQQLKSRDTSPQKEPQPDDEQKDDGGHNADDNQAPQNGARSLPIEELSIHSQGGKHKRNKTALISKTSSARRVMHLENCRIAEKEIEMAKVSSSCGYSFRSISPVETPDDNLTKVSDWMDKTEEAENVALTCHQVTSKRRSQHQ